MSQFKAVPHYVAYYMNLHLVSSVKGLRYRFKDSPVVYAIRCRVTGMMYIGSTMLPDLRFHQHLTVGNTNLNLQNAIKKHGLSNFIVYILEVAEFPRSSFLEENRSFLLRLEQSYISFYPKTQLYNSINSFKSN